MRLPPKVRDWPPALREDYEERAAIRQYTGGATRAEAEREAEAEIRARVEGRQLELGGVEARRGA